MKHMIIDWNRERGLLENFDPCLELKMLSEEAKEFYNAETLEHKFAEAADFLFVLEGTKAKYHCQILDSTTMFEINYNRFKELMAWAESIRINMLSLLEDACMLEPRLKYDAKGSLAISLGAVIDCNNLKPNKKKGGKVVKGENHTDPVAMIVEHIYES